MAVSKEAKEGFRKLLGDIVKELRKEESVTKGKKLHLSYLSDKNLGQIVREDPVSGDYTIAEAQLFKVNEGVRIDVNEPKAYAPIEVVSKAYEDKFTEIVLKKTYE